MTLCKGSGYIACEECGDTCVCGMDGEPCPGCDACDYVDDDWWDLANDMEPGDGMPQFEDG